MTPNSSRFFDAANPHDGSVQLRRRQPHSLNDRIRWQGAGRAQPGDFLSSAAARGDFGIQRRRRNRAGRICCKGRDQLCG